MSLIAKNNESNFKKLPLPESGTHRAVCCGVWDLGFQETTFNNEKKVQHKIVIAWEIEQKIDAPESEYHGKPYMMTRQYTLSLAEKATLRKDLQSWNGRPFTQAEIDKGYDVENLYGVNCLIGVTHENGYANVTAILPLQRGAEKMTAIRARNEAPPKWVVEKQQQALLDPNAATDLPGFMDDEPVLVSGARVAGADFNEQP